MSCTVLLLLGRHFEIVTTRSPRNAMSAEVCAWCFADEVLVRRGIRGKSRKLFRLRVATPPYAPVAWMDPTATLESLGGEPCIVSMQMLPGSMEELLEYDPTAFAYLVAQLGRWIDVGLIDFTDEDMAACLASCVALDAPSATPCVYCG